MKMILESQALGSEVPRNQQIKETRDIKFTAPAIFCKTETSNKCTLFRRHPTGNPMGTRVLIGGILTVLFGVYQAFAQTNLFSLACSMRAGASPNCVTVVDVSGNCKSDLAVTSWGNTGLLLFTNGGNGVFGYNSWYYIGARPDCVIAVDLNCDGKQDLVAAYAGTGPYDSESNGGLVVLTNNGGGGFGSNATYQASPFDGYGSTSCKEVVTMDINNDSKPDVISINGNGTVTVFTNDGSGLLVSNAIILVGFWPQAGTTVDVNGDGKQDLVVSVGSSHGVLVVLTNNGNGALVYSAFYPVGNNPLGVAAADVNGDGWSDLICVNTHDKSLMVLTNDGAGNLGSNGTYSVYLYHPESVVAADVNYDGKPDLICTADGYKYGSLTLLTNDGSGGFVLAGGFLPGSSEPAYVISADVNSDGSLDLISVGDYPSDLSVFTNSISLLLNIKSDINHAVISWSSSLVNWALQQNAGLDMANWVGVTNTVNLVDGQNRVVIPKTAGKAFFRLKQQ
jgi:hypothetical protein